MPPFALAVAVGFVLRKPIGVEGFASLAVRCGLAERPAGLGWGTLAGGGLLAGIGFTMALFIGDLAFQGTLLQATKLGILVGALVSAAGGLALLAWLGRGRPRHPDAAGAGLIDHCGWRVGWDGRSADVRAMPSISRTGPLWDRFHSAADLGRYNVSGGARTTSRLAHILQIYYRANRICSVVFRPAPYDMQHSTSHI